MKKTKLNKKTILNFIALFLLAFNCSYAQLLKSLKDKINAMKPASDVAGIFQMTQDDVKKMQQDSASDILDKEFEKLKNEPDPLNINGVYYLKYPMLVKSGSNQIFTKKVLILFRERKNRIYLLNSLTIGGGKDTLFIEEPGNGGQGLRSNKKFGSLCYNSSS